MSRRPLRLLQAALVSAYPADEKLARFVMFDLNRNLDQLAKPGDLDSRASDLIVAARSGGWLDDLKRDLIELNPHNEAVRQFAEASGLGQSIDSGLAVPKAARLFNDAYFDLAAVRNKVYESHLNANGKRGLLGLSVVTDEDSVAKRLCAWLPDCFGDLQEKDNVTLSAVMSDPDHKVKQVLQHLPELEDTGVVCRVLVNDISLGALEQFWQDVRAACQAIENWFVLVFVTRSDTHRAADVIDLGRPRFESLDVYKWTNRAAQELDWPREFATPWSQWIERVAAVDGVLSIPLTYGALNRSAQGVKKHRNDPGRFLEWLKER
ncbi:effector-associated domain EAD1-containing protein [Actinoplanes sp. NPDC048796]|uniref:effector-associated domain EAD1-containing protein n=1 Tax=unclassified Actinoplanes TaxID=2626549 RepID=UPI0033F183F3